MTKKFTDEKTGATEVAELSKYITDKKAKINHLIDTIRSERSIIQDNRRELEVTKGKSDDNYKNYLRNNYQMMAWGLATIAVTGLTIKLMST